MGSWLRTILFFTGWIAFTLGFGLLALPVLVSRRATWAAAQLWAAASLQWIRISCGITTRLEGLQHLPAGPAIIASKHQSAWDTLVLWRVLKSPAFIMKRELYYIPVFGWYLWRCGQVAIDRKAGRAAMEAINYGATKALAEGRKIVIFPEGTRIPAGQEKEFRPGVARLSQALNMPVIPAALNAGLHWPKRTLRKTAGEATLAFLPAMEACGADVDGWLRELQTRINAQTRKLGG